jgi:hypothetical protein
MTMEARFVNGTSVSRIYGDNSKAELIAVFEYELDATEFAYAKLKDDAERKWFELSYVIVSMYTGKISIVRHNRTEKGAAA